MIEDRDAIVADYRVIIRKLTDTKALDETESRLVVERDEVLGQIKTMVEGNARMVLDQDDYSQMYTKLVDRYEELQARLAELNSQRNERQARLCKLNDIVTSVECGLVQNDFDERLWVALVERVMVGKAGGLGFEMKDESKCSKLNYISHIICA